MEKYSAESKKTDENKDKEKFKEDADKSTTSPENTPKPLNPPTGIGVFESTDTESVKLVADFIQKKMESSGYEKEESALKKMEAQEDLEGGDFQTLVSDLQMADFNSSEIKMIVESFRQNNLAETIASMIDLENKGIIERLNNPEFKKALDVSQANMKLLAMSVDKLSFAEERWPKVIYAGKLGRMIIKSKKENQMSTNCMAGAEYDDTDKTAYVYLTADSNKPAGKEILEAQIHEMTHGIGFNKITEGEKGAINKNGFGTINFDDSDPLNTSSPYRNFNEGVTEYYARKFCNDSFQETERQEHEYDTHVKNFRAWLEFISKRTGQNVDDVERTYFSEYMEGNADQITKMANDALGKFGEELLEMWPNNLSDFLETFLQYQNGNQSGEKIKINADNLRSRNVPIKDFTREYPFVVVIDYDVDPQTFEMRETVVSE